MFKTYKYRLYPNLQQTELLNKHFGTCRFIYNLALETKNYTWISQRKYLSSFDLQKQLTELKKEHVWLSEINSQSLQAPLHNLDEAFTRFMKGQTSFPKFKSKHSKQSFYVPQNVEIRNNKLSVPKFKNGIKCIISKPIIGKIKDCTITKNPSNQYFVSILVEQEVKEKIKPKIKESTSIGIDLGIKSFAITSDGRIINNPKYYKTSLYKLKKLQKILSKKQKGSKNRKKLSLKIARLHNKIKNQRQDFLHKLSKQLVDNQDTIILETLAIKNMVKNHKLAQSISDVGWGEFVRQLKYKSDWYNKNLIQIGQFEPSSKTCSACGFIKKDLTLKDRTWECFKCKTIHDRDINAANNIKSFGLIRSITKLKTNSDIKTV